MKSLIFILLAFSSKSLALDSRPQGYERGNGGFLMICSSQSFLGAGVFSVDHIEATYLHALPAAESLKLLRDEVEVVRYILNKLHTVNPTRASLYTQWLQELLSSREFVKNFTFIPLPDSSTTMIPEHCKQEQAAIFITTPGKSKLRFLFNRNLWEQASTLDRAYLLLHELIYREALLSENNHANSVAARYLNAWLFHSVEDLNQQDLLELLRSLHFSRGDYNGVTLRLFVRTPTGNFTGVRLAPIIYFPDSNKIRVAPLADSFMVRIGEDIFHRVCNESFINEKFPSFVEFYPSGKIKKMVFQSTDGNVPHSYTPGYLKTQCSYKGKNKLEFNENGELTSASSVPESLNDAYLADAD
ncbi:hypothetical protein ACNH6C_10540 [Bdellovibrio bacteriovorus]|uniref:hypothetical protein n=1 Tax=Bdellovibrio bacteriovorus TaxID=959 RepID=UPI003A8047D0